MKTYTCQVCRGLGGIYIKFYHKNYKEVNKKVNIPGVWKKVNIPGVWKAVKYNNWVCCTPELPHKHKDMCWQCGGKGRFDWAGNVGKNMGKEEFIKEWMDVNDIEILEVLSCLVR